MNNAINNTRDDPSPFETMPDVLVGMIKEACHSKRPALVDEIVERLSDAISQADPNR